MKLLNDTLVPHWRALLDFYVMKGILYLSLIKLYHTFSLLSICQYSRNSKRVFVQKKQKTDRFISPFLIVFGIYSMTSTLHTITTVTRAVG
jgi:hypothetical protein